MRTKKQKSVGSQRQPITMLDVLLVLFLLCLFVYTAYLILTKLNPYGLNSDIVNEISYRQLSWEQKTFFPEGFRHSNESFANRPVILYWIFYGLTQNFMLSFQLEDICALAIQLISLVYLLHSLKINRHIILFILCMYVGWMPVGIAGILFWPMCAYSGYAIMIILTCTLYVKIYQRVNCWEDLKKRSNSLPLLAILSMAIGFGYTTIKMAVMLYTPLVCVGFYHLIMAFINRRLVDIRQIIMLVISSVALVINMVFYGFLLHFHGEEFSPAGLNIASITDWLDWKVISSQLQSILEVFGIRGSGSLGSVYGLQFVISGCFMLLAVTSIIWLLKTYEKHTTLGEGELLLYWLFFSILMFLIEICTAESISIVRYYFVTALLLPIFCGLALNDWSNLENVKFLQWPCAVIALAVLILFGTNLEINHTMYSADPIELVRVAIYIKDNGYKYVTASYWNAGVIKGYTNGLVETQHSGDQHGIATLTPYLWLIDQRTFSEERLGEPNILLLTDEEEQKIFDENGAVSILLSERAEKVMEIEQYNLYALSENPYTLVQKIEAQYFTVQSAPNV